MGLREKRAIEIVKERDLPSALAEISTYLGTSFPIVVDWDSVETAGEDAVFSVPGMGLRPIVNAMLTASHDNFLKKAFAEQIKEARIAHVAESGAKSLEVKDGILSLKVNFADHYEGAFADHQIHDALLNGL